MSAVTERMSSSTLLARDLVQDARSGDVEEMEDVLVATWNANHMCMEELMVRERSREEAVFDWARRSG